jgi:hypothetical protein
MTFKNNGVTRLLVNKSYDNLSRLTSISSKAFGAAAPVQEKGLVYQFNLLGQKTVSVLANTSGRCPEDSGKLAG